MRLTQMSNAELIEEARRRANAARENDKQLGVILERLTESVGELTRRLDEHGG